MRVTFSPLASFFRDTELSIICPPLSLFHHQAITPIICTHRILLLMTHQVEERFMFWHLTLLLFLIQSRLMRKNKEQGLYYNLCLSESFGTKKGPGVGPLRTVDLDKKIKNNPHNQAKLLCKSIQSKLKQCPLAGNDSVALWLYTWQTCIFVFVRKNPRQVKDR